MHFKMFLSKSLYYGLRQLSTSIPKPAARCQLLKGRKLVRVSGENAGDLLQGKITNDINHLGAYPFPTAIYSMFLNSYGRAICDTLIYRTEPNSYLVECDSQLQEQLVQHLKFHKLRMKATIKAENDIEVWVVHPTLESSLEESTNTFQYQAEPLSLGGNAPLPQGILQKVSDPRLKYLGARVLSTRGVQVPALLEIPESMQQDTYTELRHRLGVPEGTTDLPNGDTMPLESNLDLLNGVSFHKGCYLGQELTARVYHTGEIRKRIMPVLLPSTNNPPKPNEPIVNEDGKSLGRLRSCGSQYGLALLRIEPSLKSQSLSVDGTQIKTGIPSWWPSDRH